MSTFNDSLDLSARRTLSEYGWLSGIRTALDQPVTIDELSCPECEDETELLSWEEPGDMCTIIMCRSCEYRDEISDRELYHDD
jgi:Zn ribbon nucleic-acid-binding protein